MDQQKSTTKTPFRETGRPANSLHVIQLLLTKDQLNVDLRNQNELMHQPKKCYKST